MPRVTDGSTSEPTSGHSNGLIAGAHRQSRTVRAMGFTFDLGQTDHLLTTTRAVRKRLDLTRALCQVNPGGN